MNRFILPLLVLVAICGFLYVGLQLDPRKIPSVLIDRDVPVFTLPTLYGSSKPTTQKVFIGKVTLFNVWASWCAPCKQEHPILLALAQQHPDLQLVGMSYKDNPQRAINWLSKYGNPFSRVISDNVGDVAIDWGVYGVPESYIIDKQGKIRYKHIGIITNDDMAEIFLPIIERLQEEGI